MLNDFVIMIGALTFTYTTSKTHNELVEYLQDYVKKNEPFRLTMDKNGPIMIINPAPGMMIIVCTKEQFERQRLIQNMTGRA